MSTKTINNKNKLKSRDNFFVQLLTDFDIFKLHSTILTSDCTFGEGRLGWQALLLSGSSSKKGFTTELLSAVFDALKDMFKSLKSSKNTFCIIFHNPFQFKNIINLVFTYEQY